MATTVVTASGFDTMCDAADALQAATTGLTVSTWYGSGVEKIGSSDLRYWFLYN